MYLAWKSTDHESSFYLSLTDHGKVWRVAQGGGSLDWGCTVERLYQSLFAGSTFVLTLLVFAFEGQMKNSAFAVLYL